MAAAGEQSPGRLRPRSTGSSWPGWPRTAKFDSLFLADGPALTGTGEFRPPGQLEPLTLLTALSQATSRIGLIATVSSTYNEPYNLARRLASVDHVSGGRAGWNIVTSAGDDEAANFGLADRPDHAARYARADEFLQVAKALWDSWEAEAVVADKAGGRYADPARIRTPRPPGPVLHGRGAAQRRAAPAGLPAAGAGRFVRGRQELRGPARRGDLHRAPDLRAGGRLLRATSSTGRARPGVTRTACIVLPGIVPYHRLDRAGGAGAWPGASTSCGSRSTACWQLARIFEREPSATSSSTPRCRTSVLARPKLEGSQSRSDLIIELAVRENLTVRQILSRLGGGRGHFDVRRHARNRWPTRSSSGSTAAPPTGSTSWPRRCRRAWQTFIEHVLPILRGKGLFREEYAGTTLREHYGLPVPANQFRTSDLAGAEPAHA